ncbi:hypothetical protein PCL_06510 [Purpureocillium lilacinum]|uniref:Uncharacterized protein n=1 Tax=Purpureocillium lilacinum TaxID=33203 RepID=A0A2U3EMZ6_PURLI|nr:hypothetical protein PCL_06510 [Purpureocillium lilacinum]
MLVRCKRTRRVGVQEEDGNLGWIDGKIDGNGMLSESLEGEEMGEEEEEDGYYIRGVTRVPGGGWYDGGPISSVKPWPHLASWGGVQCIARWPWPSMRPLRAPMEHRSPQLAFHPVRHPAPRPASRDSHLRSSHSRSSNDSRLGDANTQWKSTERSSRPTDSSSPDLPRGSERSSRDPPDTDATAQGVEGGTHPAGALWPIRPPYPLPAPIPSSRPGMSIAVDARVRFARGSSPIAQWETTAAGSSPPLVAAVEASKRVVQVQVARLSSDRRAARRPLTARSHLSMNPCSPGLARPTGLRAWATGLGFLHCLDCLVLQLVSAGWCCCPATSSTAGTGQKDLNHQLMLPFSSCSPESGYCCPGLGNYGDVSCEVRPDASSAILAPNPPARLRYSERPHGASAIAGYGVHDWRWRQAPETHLSDGMQGLAGPLGERGPWRPQARTRDLGCAPSLVLPLHQQLGVGMSAWEDSVGGRLPRAAAAAAAGERRTTQLPKTRHAGRIVNAADVAAPGLRSFLPSAP